MRRRQPRRWAAWGAGGKLKPLQAHAPRLLQPPAEPAAAPPQKNTMRTHRPPPRRPRPRRPRPRPERWRRRRRRRRARCALPGWEGAPLPALPPEAIPVCSPPPPPPPQQAAAKKETPATKAPAKGRVREDTAARKVIEGAPGTATAPPLLAPCTTPRPYPARALLSQPCAGPLCSRQAPAKPVKASTPKKVMQPQALPSDGLVPAGTTHGSQSRLGQPPPSPHHSPAPRHLPRPRPSRLPRLRARRLQGERPPPSARLPRPRPRRQPRRRGRGHGGGSLPAMGVRGQCLCSGCCHWTLRVMLASLFFLQATAVKKTTTTVRPWLASRASRGGGGGTGD